MKKKIQIVYADPPWKYNDRKNVNTRFGGGAMKHYPCMSVQEICDMGPFIWKKLADDALLFIWTTGPYLMDTHDVIESWGFKYVTIAFTWLKTTMDNSSFIAGPGNYTGSNAELVLLGRRGKALKPARRLVPQVVVTPRYEHSRKPYEVQNAISEMYPDQVKLEMFARRVADHRKNWYFHGNELPKTKGLVIEV